MLLFILLILSSVIISRFLKKKSMKVASITYTIMFIMLFTYVVLTSGMNGLVNVISEERYAILKSALVRADKTNTLLLVEMIVIILSIISMVLEVVKLKEHFEDKIKQDDEEVIINILLKTEEITKEKQLKGKEVYIEYCKMLN